ncbi:MAG TPA: helix-turn-helix transcriptional regulator [Rhodocyclaceae bacterium]|nr:helix-turn-helix transcriptional regulator [Rhodocyclaceae bacterium]
MTTTVNTHVNIRDLLAANLKRLRAERGWSQEQLAHEAGLHRTFVAHVERKMRNISIDNIERLARALGVSPSALLAEGTPVVDPE